MKPIWSTGIMVMTPLSLSSMPKDIEVDLKPSLPFIKDWAECILRLLPGRVGEIDKNKDESLCNITIAFLFILVYNKYIK